MPNLNVMHMRYRYRRNAALCGETSPSTTADWVRVNCPGCEQRVDRDRKRGAEEAHA